MMTMMVAESLRKVGVAVDLVVAWDSWSFGCRAMVQDLGLPSHEMRVVFRPIGLVQIHWGFGGSLFESGVVVVVGVGSTWLSGVICKVVRLCPWRTRGENTPSIGICVFHYVIIYV
uniref:Uncharacterized protein n=1 Tax=Cannabis sativa TaxID=3483 RepID=A0A803NJX0_CANSA